MTKAKDFMEAHAKFLRSGLSCYLFIYLVRRGRADAGASGDLVEASGPGEPGAGEPDGCSYCTVLAYGRTLEAAERVAINRVHQQGLHIVRTDTATAAPWLDPARDGRYLDELARFGCALQHEVAASAA
jgi:hypothetical protein